MSQGPWFLKRGDRFYGPFTTGKVMELLASNRVKNNIPVALDKGGINARPLLEWPAFGAEEESEPAPTQAEPVPEPDPPEPAPDDGGNWLIVNEDDSNRGPYEMAHLQRLLASGKLQPDTRVRQEGSQQIIKLAVLVPTKPEPHPEPVVTPAPGTRTRKAASPPKTESKAGRKLMPIIVGGLVVTVIGAIALALLPMDEGKGLPFMEKLESRLEKKPSLRKMINNRPGAEPPPYNTMVRKALSTGMYFKAEEVLKYNRDDLLIYDKTRDFEHRQISDQLDREIRFSSDRGFDYTYLLNKDDSVFAVVVSGSNMDKHKLSRSRMGDFSTSALPPLELGNETIWTTKLMEGVVAKAVWTKRKNNERYLDYVLISTE